MGRSMVDGPEHWFVGPNAFGGIPFRPDVARSYQLDHLNFQGAHLVSSLFGGTKTENISTAQLERQNHPNCLVVRPGE